MELTRAKTKPVRLYGSLELPLLNFREKATTLQHIISCCFIDLLPQLFERVGRNKTGQHPQCQNHPQCQKKRSSWGHRLTLAARRSYGSSLHAGYTRSIASNTPWPTPT